MKVFLSSTYLDLIEYRKEAAEALTRLGHHVIGMETFNARTEDPAKASLKEVGRLEIIAVDCHYIAKVLLKQNRDLEEAITLSRRAVEIYTRLRSPNLEGAQELLAEIEKKIQESR